MKRKALIEVLLPAIFITSATLITHFEFNFLHINWGLISFIFCSILVCRKYKENVFWKKYWNAFKFPIYIFFIIFRLIMAFLSVAIFQFMYVIAFGYIYFYLVKYSCYYMLGISIEYEFLLYLSITTSTITLSFVKKYEIIANEGMQKEIEREIKRKKSTNVMTQFMDELADISDLIYPKYSSDKMRYSIYLFYFILLVLSNVSPHIAGLEVVKILTDNKAVNGSFLTFFAFDNLFQNRRVVSDINKRNFLRVVKVSIAKNRRFFYPKKTRTLPVQKKER